MKKLIQLLFLFAITTGSFSQSLTEKLSGILYHVRNNIPADQLFLHIDRNLYHAGDTIWFQAYIRNDRTGVFETKSSALYVLLLNSNHVTIDSARFRIIKSMASGWLKVPEDVPLGDYSILAFTSSTMNYNPEFAFRASIKIDNLRPSQNETITKSESKNKNITLYQKSLPLSTTDLTFLPEGGTFIYGIKQRLAFNAVTSTGRTREVTGVITNQRGEKITEFKSTKYGPGVVEFTPIPGDYYFATLKDEEFKGLKWPLPSAKNSGVSMRVNNADEGLIEVILHGRKIAGLSCFLTMTMNHILVFTKDVKPDTLFRESIPTDNLPSGTAFVTLYDHELNPIAERLIFINGYKKMNIEIGVSSPSVNRGDETELTVRTTDDLGYNISSIVSIAVIDSLSGYNSGIPFPEIESAYLFDKEFYNNLPARIKSLGLRNIDSKSIDILLMTYGWRKFTPKDVALDYPEKELVNYDFLKITNPGAEKKGMSDFKLLTIEGLDSVTLMPDNKREAELFYDSLDANVKQIMIMPDKNPAKNIDPVRIEFPENKYFTDKAKLSAPDTIYSNSFQPDVSINPPDLDLYNAIMIEPVTIKAPKQPSKEYVDKNSKIYQSGGASTIYSKDFISATSLEDILYNYNPYYLDWNRKKIYLRNATYSLRSGPLPALFVLDDAAVDTTYETISELSSSEIASVTFLRGIQGFAMYGYKAIGGVVFVTTKTGSGYPPDNFYANKFKRDDDLLKQIRLFRTDIEYYIPTKSESDFMPEFQFRPTILWKSEVFIDESGPVEIKYPNNLVKGTVIVFVNGISTTNRVGSNRYSYKVK
jgi:MG2 domain